jgi:hypothetical protein
MSEALEFDQIILVCKGCGGERSFYPDVALKGANELIEWMKTKAYACPCGATHCDVKAHMKGNPCLSCGEPRAKAPGAACETKEFHEVSP